jgi:hypothetical protein
MNKVLSKQTKYVFIVDTNLYAGNFCRQICAYMTGQWDQQTHGESEADDFFEEHPDAPFDNIVEPETDDYGLLSPQRLEITPTRYNKGKHLNNSVGILLNALPLYELCNLLMQRAEKFAKQHKIAGQAEPLKILGYRILEESTTVTEIQPWQ